jgi:hypothetical protein
MKKIFAVLLIILMILGILTYRRHRHFSTSEVAGYESIIRLSEKINSKNEALEYFSEWLTKETNFNNKDNGIESINKYRGYYEIKLKISIIINSRPAAGYAYLGYRDYVVTKDGYLKGYYYSK